MSEKKQKSKRAKIGINLLSVLSGEVEIQETSEGDNFVRYGDQIAIKVCDGNYWQTRITENNIVTGQGSRVDAWELYKIVLAKNEFTSNKGQIVKYGDEISFYSLINNRFVGANLAGQCELSARVTWIKGWETFILVCPPNKKYHNDKKLRYGGWFALQGNNGKYVMFDSDQSKQLYASRDWIRDWECFVVINPSDAV